LAFFDHGGLMNKSFIVIVLAALQCACATRDAAPQAGNSLLSFTEISSEITLGYENFGESVASDQALSKGLVESP
jgi:hypothetical protein